MLLVSSAHIATVSYDIVVFRIGAMIKEIFKLSIKKSL